MPRPKNNLRQFIEALKQQQLQALAEKHARLTLSQRRNLEPMRIELMTNRSMVAPAIPEFLQTLSKDDLKAICCVLGIESSGTKSLLCSKILDFVDHEAAAPSPSGVELGLGGRRKIFIVHGHDIAMRHEVVHLLGKINIDAVVLQNEPNHGKTIIEKLEQHIAPCGHAIVLLSPDDEGHKAGAEDQRRTRARQNVIFEFGIVLGRLGRGKVIVLHKGNVELPTDIHGMVYIAYKDDDHNARVNLGNELRAMGYDVDMNVLL